MWSNLPFDLLANIFAFLPPDSLAHARLACRNWYLCSNACPLNLSPANTRQNPPWLLALPSRNHGLCCYVHNPNINHWHALSLEFLPDPIRPVSSIGSLILLRVTNSTILKLSICNPFTGQWRHLPVLNASRINPAVGIVISDSTKYSPIPYFCIYVAGGMSNAPCGGAMYESTLEMYDSQHDTWKFAGSMPSEFAIRLTVWTPNESVYCNGILYWMTSARAYSIMGLDLESNKWQEFGVPLADKLEFATLALRNQRLTLVGGICNGGASVWQLNERQSWCLIEKVPSELGFRLLGGKLSWASVKCMGGDGAICLYRDLGSGMVVWRENGEKCRWEWIWVDGCCFVGGKQVQNLSIRGVFIHPNIIPSCIFNKNK